MIAKPYLALARFWRRAQLGVDVAFTGFWLGVLDPEDLYAIDEALYTGRSGYHSDEHNLRGLFPWEAAAVSEHFSSAKRLLLLGAGGGREAVALARMGCQVTAYECNAALVATARRIIGEQKLSDATTVDLLAREAEPPAGPPVDGAIVGWSAYMLIPSRERRVALLRMLRARVADDAPVLISFFTRPDDSARLGAITRVANIVRRVRRRDRAELGDDLAPNFVHRFTPQEVEEEMEAAGFRTVAFAREGSAPHDSGWAVGRALPRPAAQVPAYG